MESIDLLTKSEVDLIKLLIKGLSNEQAARVLGCSVKDVEQSRIHIFSKLGISPRVCIVPTDALKYPKDNEKKVKREKIK